MTDIIDIRRAWPCPSCGGRSEHDPECLVLVQFAELERRKASVVTPSDKQRCRTCAHFRVTIEGSERWGNRGECDDPSKAVFGMLNDEFQRVNDPTDVHERNGCVGHMEMWVVKA